MILGGRINVQNTFSIQETVGCTATILQQYHYSSTWTSGCVAQLTNIQEGGHVIIKWTPDKADSFMEGVKAIAY